MTPTEFNLRTQLLAAQAECLELHTELENTKWARDMYEAQNEARFEQNALLTEAADELKQSLAWESKRVDELHMAQAEDSQTIASLRATLATIQTEAEAMPVPGGFTYAISGQLMGMVDEVLK